MLPLSDQITISEDTLHLAFAIFFTAIASAGALGFILGRVVRHRLPRVSFRTTCPLGCETFLHRTEAGGYWCRQCAVGWSDTPTVMTGSKYAVR